MHPATFLSPAQKMINGSHQSIASSIRGHCNIVAAPCMGKRNSVTAEQVGIRCPYCSPERIKGRIHGRNEAVYPSLISHIYNAAINLLQRHL